MRDFGVITSATGYYAEAHAELEGVVELYNPNRFACQLHNMTLRVLHDGAQIGVLNAVPCEFAARRSTELVMPVALRGLQMSVMSGWVRAGWAELSFDGAAELTYLGFPLTQRVNFTRRMEVVASELTRQAVGAQAARAGVAAADAAQTLSDAAANASRDLRSSVAGAARRVHKALGALDLSAAAQSAPRRRHRRRTGRRRPAGAVVERAGEVKSSDIWAGPIRQVRISFPQAQKLWWWSDGRILASR